MLYRAPLLLFLARFLLQSGVRADDLRARLTTGLTYMGSVSMRKEDMYYTELSIPDAREVNFDLEIRLNPAASGPYDCDL